MDFKRAKLIKGDCADKLKDLPDECVDLVFTSPPYASQREHDYGGVSPEQYVDWFLPIAAELRRVLKPTGSMVINIKESSRKHSKLTYVLELILALRQTWLWIDEYVWVKTNPYPNNQHYRMKNAYERLLHFAKQLPITFNHDAVAISKTEKDYARQRRKITRLKYTQTNSKLSNPAVSWANKTTTMRPSNVLHGENLREVDDIDTVIYGHANEVDRSHSAPFPVWLPTWFIRLMTNEGDTVLDPFVGSGTTMLAAVDLNRRAIGIELHDGYAALCKRNLDARLLKGRSTDDVIYEKLRTRKGKQDAKDLPKDELGV